MSWRPRLRTVLLAVNLTILVLPLGGVTVLRLYESALVRQTESELLGQGAFLAAAFKAGVARARGDSEGRTFGLPVDPRWPPASGHWQPRAATLDLAVDVIRPRPTDSVASSIPADPAAARAGRELLPVMRDAQVLTLAAIRLVDFHGVVVASTGEELGHSLADREEIARALSGEAVSLLRERVTDEPSPPLASISRGTRVRVFVSLPVVAGGRVLGAVLLSRSPRSIGQTLYAKRFHLLGGAILLLLIVVLVSIFTSQTVSRPLEAVVRQSRRAARGEKGAVVPLGRPMTREVAELSTAVATMARTLEERAEYIRTFASHVSHEFKTPLTAIQGAVELLRDHAETMPPAQQRRFLDNLAADAKRLERLVARLLELARAEVAPIGTQGADLRAVLEAATRRQRDLGAGISLECEPALGRVAIGAETLEAVLSNLLENARQHGGDQVGVTIQARHIGGADDGEVSIIVADDGRGVSTANALRIFDPFFTTARDHGGTGLGLSIVRALLAAQGGTISLVPSARGAAFEIRLPAA